MSTVRWMWGRTVMLVIILAASVAHAAEPVAMATDVKGNAWWSGGGKEARLNVLSYLEEGMSIRLDEQSTITVTTFSPAAEYTVTGPASLRLKGGKIRLVSGGKLQKRDQDERRINAARRFSATQRERLITASFEMKALTMSLQMLSPLNIELLTPRPVFRWSAPPDVYNFVVTLSDESDGRQVREVSVNESHWQLPENMALQRGHHYSWKVRSVPSSGGESASAGKFFIVDEARALRVLRQQPSANALFSERVLYAVLLDNEGFKADAAELWASLTAERPDEPLLKANLQKY